MAYDDVILRMGEFGRYQRRVYLLLCLPAISCAFHKLAGVFLGAKMDSRYSSNKRDDNYTVNYEEFTVKTVRFPCLQVFTSTWVRGERHVPPEPGRVECELSVGRWAQRVVPVQEPWHYRPHEWHDHWSGNWQRHRRGRRQQLQAVCVRQKRVHKYNHFRGIE